MTTNDKSVKVDLEALKDEFPHLGARVVAEAFRSADRDVERTRRALTRRIGETADEAARDVDEEEDATEKTVGSATQAKTEEEKETNKEERPKGPVVLQHIVGDLFSCEAEASLCHCVSEDLAMGKGIAVLFKERFGRVQDLKRQHAGVGQAAVLPKRHTSGRPRQQPPPPPPPHAFVYYLVTKQRYFHKPILSSLRASCESMRDHARRHHVSTVAMPRIGCGLDGLKWSNVEDTLRDVFSDTGIRLCVYSLKAG